MCLARAHAALPLMDVMQLRSVHERRYYTWGRGVLFHLRGLLHCYTVLGDHIITPEGLLRYYTWGGIYLYLIGLLLYYTWGRITC